MKKIIAIATALSIITAAVIPQMKIQAYGQTQALEEYGQTQALEEAAESPDVLPVMDDITFESPDPSAPEQARRAYVPWWAGAGLTIAGAIIIAAIASGSSDGDVIH